MMEDPVMPGKMVTTIKAPAGKKRCRLVICGNYAEGGGKDQEESLYAGGSDAMSIRTATKFPAESGWAGMVLDINTAFLNAPLQSVMKEGQGTKVVLIRPPAILVQLGLWQWNELCMDSENRQSGGPTSEMSASATWSGRKVEGSSGWISRSRIPMSGRFSRWWMTVRRWKGYDAEFLYGKIGRSREGHVS